MQNKNKENDDLNLKIYSDILNEVQEIKVRMAG